MIDFFLNWADFLWVPVAALLLRRDQKVKGVILVLFVMLALRLQVELFQEIDMARGFFPLWDWPVLYRGYLIYGVFIAAFLFLGHISKEKDPFVYMAAGISIFVLAFCLTTILMLL